MTLPQGWARTTLGDVLELNPKHAGDSDRDALVSFVPMPAVDETTGAIGPTDFRPLRDVWTGYTHFADGDVIFAKITPCMENGKAAVVSGMMNGLACGSTEFFALRSSGAILPDFVWRLLRQSSFRRAAEQRMTGAVGQRRVPRQYLEEYGFTLPPLPEQRRIVIKLDALTMRIASARAELKRVLSLQRRFRRSVFDAAVAGELSPPVSTRSAWTNDQWRSISERRADYLGNRRGSRLRSGLGVTVDPFQGSRSSWLDCRLSDVISLRVGHAFRSADFTQSGVRLLRGANIAPGRVDWNDTVRMPENECAVYSQFILYEGDIVIAMDRPLISSGLKIAQVTRADEPCLLVQRVANPRSSDFILNDYLKIVLQSSLFVKQIEDHATGSDLPHISSNDILTTACPLPPLDEQQKIVDVAQNSLARADCQEAEMARATKLLDRLEASILARAFRGELVPQDPADEPASALLDRIRAERAVAPKAKRGRPTAPTASS